MGKKLESNRFHSWWLKTDVVFGWSIVLAVVAVLVGQMWQNKGGVILAYLIGLLPFFGTLLLIGRKGDNDVFVPGWMCLILLVMLCVMSFLLPGLAHQPVIL